MRNEKNSRTEDRARELLVFGLRRIEGVDHEGGLEAAPAMK